MAADSAAPRSATRAFVARKGTPRSMPPNRMSTGRDYNRQGRRRKAKLNGGMPPPGSQSRVLEAGRNWSLHEPRGARPPAFACSEQGASCPIKLNPSDALRWLTSHSTRDGGSTPPRGKHVPARSARSRRVAGPGPSNPLKDEGRFQGFHEQEDLTTRVRPGSRSEGRVSIGIYGAC